MKRNCEVPVTSSAAIVSRSRCLGGYLADAHNGDIRWSKEIRLGDDKGQGFQARRVMESYQSWPGEGPELSTLRILGTAVTDKLTAAMEIADRIYSLAKKQNDPALLIISGFKKSGGCPCPLNPTEVTNLLYSIPPCNPKAAA